MRNIEKLWQKFQLKPCASLLYWMLACASPKLGNNTEIKSEKRDGAETNSGSINGVSRRFFQDGFRGNFLQQLWWQCRSTGLCVCVPTAPTQPCPALWELCEEHMVGLYLPSAPLPAKP